MISRLGRPDGDLPLSTSRIRCRWEYCRIVTYETLVVVVTHRVGDFGHHAPEDRNMFLYD
jgi:hypothetical protein